MQYCKRKRKWKKHICQGIIVEHLFFVEGLRGKLYYERVGASYSQLIFNLIVKQEMKEEIEELENRRNRRQKRVGY